MQIEIVIFWLSGSFLFLPLFLYKSLFLKMAILAYGYPVWLMVGFASGMPVTRIMRDVGAKFYLEHLEFGALLSFLSYLAFLIALWPIRLKEHSMPRLRISMLGRFVLLGTLMVSCAVAYPKAFGLSDFRFGTAGSIVIFLSALLILSIPRKQKYDFVTLVHLVFILFMVFRGERVDFVLNVIVILAYYFRSSNVSLFSFGLYSFLGLVLATIGGAMRHYGSLDLLYVFQTIPFLVSNFGTAIDVVHVYMSAVWYFDVYGPNVDPLINIFASYFPFFPGRGASSELNYVFILKEHINNLGGGLFYIAGLMAFGAGGVIFFGYLYGLLLRKAFTLKGVLSVFFIALSLMQFRVQWYGATYFGSVFLLFIFFYFFYLLLKEQGIARKRMV